MTRWWVAVRFLLSGSSGNTVAPICHRQENHLEIRFRGKTVGGKILQTINNCCWVKNYAPLFLQRF